MTALIKKHFVGLKNEHFCYSHLGKSKDRNQIKQSCNVTAKIVEDTFSVDQGVAHQPHDVLSIKNVCYTFPETSKRRDVVNDRVDQE